MVPSLFAVDMGSSRARPTMETSHILSMSLCCTQVNLLDDDGDGWDGLLISDTQGDEPLALPGKQP